MLGVDFDDFVELADQESEISQTLLADVFLSEELVESNKEHEHLDKSLDIGRLLLFGLLYCKGSYQEKSTGFYDVLQDSL